MKILWCSTLDSPIAFEFDYHGVFWEDKNDLLFFFSKSIPNHKTLDYVRVNEKGKGPVKRIAAPSKLGLPSSWVVDKETKEYLICEDCCLNLSTLAFCENIRDSFISQYRYRASEWGLHLLEDDFSFDEYTISHRGAFGYSCKKAGDLIWTFRGYAYLYTDIVRYKDSIFFGTDGQGGHFYILDLPTGSVLCDINTHGTNHYARAEDRIYLLVGGKRSQVVSVSLETCELVDTIDLPARVSSYSRICLWNNKLYVVAFRKQRDGSEESVMICVDRKRE